MERFESNGRYHDAICHNGILYLSGQTATEAGDDVVQQTQKVLGKIAEKLEIYGSDKRHILHADIYLREQEDTEAFNAVWDAWIEAGTEPTRALMIAKLGRPAIHVEIVLTAAIKTP